MTKRLLATLLAITLLLSMVIAPANAAEVTENVTPAAELCPCGCGLSLSQISWKPYDANTNSAPMGHYYLDGDYAQAEQRTLISGSKTVIDLRGHTLTTDGSHRLFLVEGYLAVLDTVGGGRMQAKTTGGGYGGVLMIRENETTDSTFELYSGTLTVDPDSNSSKSGGLVYVSAGSIFRMYGGILRDGSTIDGQSGGAVASVTATSRVHILGGTIMDCSSGAAGGAIYSTAGSTTELKNCRILNCSATTTGGAVRQTGGKLTIENVLIAACSSGTSGGSIYSSGTTTIKNSQLLNGTSTGGNGGNLYQTSGSLTMENCDIAYGTALGTTGGGNICLTATTFTDNGSIIRDGFAPGGSGNGGGNLYIGEGTYTLTGTTIRGGVTQSFGANILNWKATTTRMIDCNIAGDVRWAGEGLSLEGKTMIGLRSNGLNLVGGKAGTVISASKLTDGAEIFVSAHYGTFTNDEANLDYFKPALRTILRKDADGKLSGTLAASGAEGGYCPHCYDPTDPKQVTWQPYTATTDSAITESGHYYLSDSATARLNIEAGKDVVIDLAGKSITSTHRTFVMKEGATLSILDFSGTGKVVGKGGSGWPGGVFYGEKPYTLNLYCGTFTYTPLANKHVAKGGVISAPAGSSINIYGGLLDGSAYDKTESTNTGGVVSLTDGASAFCMTAGRVIGGNAYEGGSLHFGAGNTVKITGGVIADGSSASGAGNIFFVGSPKNTGTAQLENCAIVNGETASGGGGNISCTQYTLDMDHCYLAGGVSAGYGGNLNQRSGMKGNIRNTLILSGRASKGGNLYAAALNSDGTYTNCTIIGGQVSVPTGSTNSSDGHGGNIYSNNGKMTFVGGEIAYGTAARSGGNIYAYSGINADGFAAGDKLVLKADAAKEISAPVVTGGYAKQNGGNLFVVGVAHITDAVLCAGRALKTGQDLYLSQAANTSLVLGVGLTGKVRMGVSSKLLGTPVYGNPIAATSVTDLNASITLEGNDLPLFAHEGSLFVGGATVVDKAGEETWYIDNAAAVAACDNEEYVKLYTTDALVLTKDLAVDINGQTVAVSGNGKLLGMDSTGDDYILPAGKITGTVTVSDITHAPNGNTYLSVKESDGVTYHRLGMAITDIALRPSNAGLYYKAAWSGDAVVKEMITEYGIAASLADMPQDNFRTDPNHDNLWVSFTDKITDGAKKCGVLISDILDQANKNEDNDANGHMPIYAVAYVTLTDGTTYVSREKAVYSLYDFMEQLDGLIQTDPTNFRRFEKQAKEFYATWETKGLADWKFNRLKAPVDPTTDNEFNVLMVGSSYCSYYVQELYHLLVEAGYENVRVCNVYYSGCYVDWHYNWWQQGKSNYQMYQVDAESIAAEGKLTGGQIGRAVVSNAASLEFCLAQHNWDVISLQESHHAIRNSGVKAQGVSAELLDREAAAHQHWDVIGNKCGTLLDYFHSEFPQSRIMWHQPWSYQIGADRSGYQMKTAEQQRLDMQIYYYLALDVINNYSYVERVPSGEAWQVVREKYNYDLLCARVGSGTDHEGDYSHDGDIGGGQLLNACVWYEIITGKDCTKLSFVPTYGHNGAVVENRFDADIIKAAAHEAVLAMNN